MISMGNNKRFQNQLKQNQFQSFKQLILRDIPIQFESKKLKVEI